MARLLRHWQSEPSVCAYLPKETSSLEYRLMLDVSTTEMDQLLERGWRRFGPAYFRPHCAHCQACVPLRIPVESFRPSKQQRRVMNRARRYRIEVGLPRVDDTRLDLYRRWHRYQGEARGWSEDRIDAQEYYHQFAFPHPCVREFAYYDDEPKEGTSTRLIGVAIVDETPKALSAVYTYYDPDYHRDSLGTASILFQLQEARRLKKSWLYLGYRVMGCPSSEYKARFQPHELLVQLPKLERTPDWKLNQGRWNKSRSELG